MSALIHGCTRQYQINTDENNVGNQHEKKDAVSIPQRRAAHLQSLFVDFTAVFDIDTCIDDKRYFEPKRISGEKCNDILPSLVVSVDCLVAPRGCSAQRQPRQCTESTCTCHGQSMFSCAIHSIHIALAGVVLRGHDPRSSVKIAIM